MVETHVTPEREKLIRDHWEKQRGWPTECDTLCVPIIQPVRVTFGESSKVYDVADAVLEFRREYGTQDGKPAMRIVCEGVVVELVPASIPTGQR